MGQRNRLQTLANTSIIGQSSSKGKRFNPKLQNKKLDDTWRREQYLFRNRTDSLDSFCFIVARKIKHEEQDHHEEAIVTVKDTGSGIHPEIFPRLFTKFSGKSFSGTGLGLYISKNIVEAHGGKIWTQNNNEQGKHGATFSFSSPLD